MSRLRALPVPAAVRAGALPVAAATVGWPGSRWPPLVGTVSCLVILVGAFVLDPGTPERLADPGSGALLVGTVVQVGGTAVAAAGAAARPRTGGLAD